MGQLIKNYESKDKKPVIATSCSSPTLMEIVGEKEAGAGTEGKPVYEAPAGGEGKPQHGAKKKRDEPIGGCMNSPAV